MNIEYRIIGERCGKGDVEATDESNSDRGPLAPIVHRQHPRQAKTEDGCHGCLLQGPNRPIQRYYILGCDIRRPSGWRPLALNSTTGNQLNPVQFRPY
jgi:hypothetical protein